MYSYKATVEGEESVLINSSAMLLRLFICS
jgi:hypothetical protein